ncbi:MAG: pantoate--beta-alanine ligase [Bacteroidetes bacterium]|nr:pantoate--beta-alanine ligase [Bacteroidota bacterium]
MIIFNSIEQLQNHLNSIRNQKKTIGFVPTMGALHAGHISLVNSAKVDCDVVVCSIFVNPTQFNDLSDLDKYPRTLDADCQLLEKAGCDIVFAPEVKEMYTHAELELKRQKIEDKSWTQGKMVDFGDLEKVMEGAQRPGHFNGVAQVVSKLFRIVEPNKAYFGQKDFQQLAIIRSMVQQLGMPIQIIACPILREPNGLAMSSRNERLTKQERELAAVISQTLFQIQNDYLSKSTTELKTWAEDHIKTVPSVFLEYIEISDADTLQPIADFNHSKSAVVCIAVKLGAVRLIDNVVLY